MEFQSLKLAQTAKKVVEVCAAVKEGEQVCVVTDTNKLSIAQALAQACAAVGAETVVCIMAPRKMHGNELPPVVAAAMKAAQCIIAPTTYAPTHTDATKEALKAGARIFILREITEETFTEGAATADYEEIYQVTSALA
ncbi:MAG: aminopeptidase, partial [Chloroflexota bacterium]|nr:aminopeptidase [Chloroflexota bacterium]